MEPDQPKIDPGFESLRAHRAELLESMRALEQAVAAPASGRPSAGAERGDVALVDRVRVSQVAPLRVERASIAWKQFGDLGLAKVARHLVLEQAPWVELATRRAVEQAGWVSWDGNQLGRGVALYVGDAGEQAPGVGHLRVGEDLLAGAVFDGHPGKSEPGRDGGSERSDGVTPAAPGR